MWSRIKATPQAAFSIRTFRIFSMAVTSSSADRVLKAKLQEQSVKELWMFIGAVILLLSCIRAGRYLFSRVYRTTVISRLVTAKSDPECLDSIPKVQMSFRRLPAACLSAFRIVAFRVSIPIGPSSVMLVSELTFICGYIIAIFTWLLVNSKCSNAHHSW